MTLVIAGEGTLRGDIERRGKELGLTDILRLPGHRTDIIALHSAFDIFVQSSEREGTPNAVLEAMALETPIVATDAGGTDELMKDGVHGVMVPRNDVHALTAALDWTISNPDEARSRASAARQVVENELSFERRMRRVEDVYAELMAGGGRAKAMQPVLHPALPQHGQGSRSSAAATPRRNQCADLAHSIRSLRHKNDGLADSIKPRSIRLLCARIRRYPDPGETRRSEARRPGRANTRVGIDASVSTE